jgi:hypothetical protein
MLPLGVVCTFSPVGGVKDVVVYPPWDLTLQSLLALSWIAIAIALFTVSRRGNLDLSNLTPLSVEISQPSVE